MTEDRSKPTAETPPWPGGGSEMAGRIRTHDWAATALGPIEEWPQSLKTVVDLILANPVANILVCGPRRVLIYNDACIPLYGGKHPHALGLEGPDAFPELWDEIGPLYDRVFAGERLTFEAQPWVFDRGAAAGGAGLYDAWFTPGRGEDGGIDFTLVTAIEVTERERAQAALGESEEHLAAIFHEAAVGLSVVDHEGRFVRVNEELSRILGRPREELLRLGIADVTHPDDLPHTLAVVREAVETGRTAALDKRYRKPDKTLVCANSSATPLENGGGGSGELLVVTTDLTERMRTEAALRESEKRLAAEVAGSRLLQQLSTRLIPEQSPDALYEQILDVALELMRADAVSIQLMEDDGKRLRRVATRNLHPESTEYWTWVDASHASTCGQALARNERVMVEDVEAEPGLAGTGDLKAFRASGTRAVQSSPLLTRTGRPIGMISTHWRAPRGFEESDFGLFDLLARQVADLFERSRNEAAVRESEERQAFLLTLSDALRAEPDADAVALFALRTLTERLGLDRCYIAEYRLDEDSGDIPYQMGNDRVPPLPESVRLSDFPDALNIAAGRTLVIDDVAEAEFLSAADKRNMQGLGMGALVTGAARKGDNVPLLAIVAVSADPRDWTPGEIALIEEVNERTWAALERTRAEAALRESEERQAFLLDLSDALRPLADPAEIERTACRLLVEHLGVNRAIYLEFEGSEESGVAVIRGQHARGVPPFPERISYLEYARGFAVRLLEAHETIVVADAATDPRLEDNVRETWLDTDVAAVVATSLIKDGRMVANFGLQSAVAHEWTAAEIRLVEEVADRTWAAVERSRAEAALRESEERKAFLLALGDAMRSQSDTSGRIDAAARLLGERLGASRVLYAEFDHARGVADICNGWLADGAEPFPEALQLEDHDGPIMDGLRAGRTVRIDDVGPLVDQPAYAAIAGIGVRALLSVPLVVNGELVVNLSVHQHEAHHWTDDEVALAQQVAERLWAEVVRARAEAKLRESEERYLTLFESIDQGFCVVEMLFDDHDNPVDYRFLEVSPSFERQTGIADAAGRRMREIAPDHEEHWFRTYGEIALTGEPMRFESAAQALGRWFDVYAYRVDEPEKRRVAILFNDITARRQAEAALRESEERFRGFAENSADVLWILNGETGQLEYLSPAFESIWGESRDAVMRDIRRWGELVHPDDRDKASRAMPLLLAGRAHAAIYRIVRPDGEVRWIRDTEFPIHDDGIKRAGGIAQDVTDLAEIEARLASEEERSRLALDAGRLATWDWNLRENTVAWNEEHFRMQGYRVGEVEPSYEAWSARIHPEDLDRTLEALARARDTHGQYRHEFRNLLPGGGVTWCLAHGRFLYAPDGTPQRMIGVMEDVTQRRMAEDALRESEARLRLIYDSLDEYAIITLDRIGFVTSWNEGAERLLGYSETEAVGMDGRAIFTPEDLEQGAAEREIETALGTGRAANERWHVRRDRSRFWGSGALLRLRDGDGDGDGEPVLVKIMRDETARRETDERLRESESRLRLLLAELQHRVRNLLGMVRSLVRRSSHGYADIDEFLAHLIGRLDALGRTQIVITRGIDARVDLETLVRDELAAQTDQEERFDLEGPEVALSAKAAEVLALALHELATNSLKYGVIGEPKGSLGVNWWVTKRNGQDWLDLRWSERGNSTQPSRARVGFGTELIEQRVPYELQGEGTLEITAAGVEARITFPLSDQPSLLEAGAPRELS